MEKHSQSGFTLIELLVITAIIAILAAIAIPQFAFYRAKGFDALTERACKNAALEQKVYFATNAKYTIDPFELNLLSEYRDVEVSILPGHTGDIKSSYEITCRSPQGTWGFVCIWDSDPFDGESYMHCRHELV